VVTDELLVDVVGESWFFTLDHPSRRNALSASLVDALLDGVERAHAARASLLVFRGAGVNFSAGFDFTDWRAASEGDLLLRFVRIEQLLDAVASSPAMTMALAHGRNFGAGADLFAACRTRIATPEATFRMPGLKFGLVLGTRRFGDIVGNERARSILQRSAEFSAADAVAMGFVHSLCEQSDWSEAMAKAGEAVALLDRPARLDLFEVLGHRRADRDADMAALVRSAARPGLKKRIEAYLDKGSTSSAGT
jgi:enoyl-CoA hydratase